MKKIIIHIIGIFIIFILASCEQESLQVAFPEKTIKLTFSMQDKQSRVVSDGVISERENKVTEVHLFFFDASGKFVTKRMDLEPTMNPAVSNDQKWRMTVNVPLADEQGTELSAGTYTVYAIANSDVADDDNLMTNVNYTITSKGTDLAVKDLEDSFIFSSAIETEIDESTCFIMDGKEEVTITEDYEASREIPLVRAAAKISLDLRVYSSIKVGETTYEPQTTTNGDGAIKLSYYHGVKTYGMTDIIRFDAENRIGIAGTTDETAQLTPIAFDPFYSYPTKWQNNDEFEPYFLLEIKWGESPTDDQTEIDFNSYYYKIPVNRKFTDNDGNLCLLRNNLYNLILNVGVLGSIDPNNPVTLSSEYKIMEWGDFDINTSVQNFKYLVVEPSELSIYNLADAEFSFASSHDITVTVDRIEYDYYGKATTRNIKITSTSKTVNPELANFDDGNQYEDYTVKNNAGNYTSTSVPVELAQSNNGTIDFKHTIKDNTFVPHTIYLTVNHKGDTSDEYKREIKIIQYPPIYIVGAKSNGKVFVNGKAFSGNNSGVYVYDDKDYNIGAIANPSDYYISGADDAVNENQNLYNVYVTLLPDNNYMIGDPRVAVGVTSSYITELKNYRQTREGAENVIAPAFKIASSYGKTTGLSSYAAAVRRCASYQENGYPAGRWRVPTAAEIAFIQERSKNGDIPSLFNGEDQADDGEDPQYSGYWAAYQKAYWPGYLTDSQTPYGPDAGAYSTEFLNCNKHAVRCVYDVWYWGDENTGNVYYNGYLANSNDPDYQKTNAVWGDEGTVKIK